MRSPVSLWRESKIAGPYIPTSNVFLVMTGVVLEYMRADSTIWCMFVNLFKISLEIKDVKFLAHKTLPVFAIIAYKMPLKDGTYTTPSLDTEGVTVTSSPTLTCHFKASLEIVEESIFCKQACLVLRSPPPWFGHWKQMLNKSILVTINNLLPPLNKMPFLGTFGKGLQIFWSKIDVFHHNKHIHNVLNVEEFMDYNFKPKFACTRNHNVKFDNKSVELLLH